jgi:uncharacterized membrane protein YeaQ/YmgE (transglycosylase-associated protein family)
VTSEYNSQKSFYMRRIMGIFSWIVLGILAGILAKFIYPGTQGGGLIATTGLGVLGAIIGGFLSTRLLGLDVTGINLTSILVATGGAIVAIFIWGMFNRSASA